MNRHTVNVAAVAERHIRLIEAWWATNRPKAPDLFVRELTAAIERLEIVPLAGSPYDAPRPAGTRRMLLRGSGYYVYYTIDDRLAAVTIRAVWHCRVSRR